MTIIYPKVINKSIPQGILPAGIYSIPFGMDESIIRMERLRELLHSEYEGKQVQLAAKLGRQADYISRILSGKKALSGDLAREFERLLEKPKYWLDGEQWVKKESPNTLSPQALEVARAFDALPEAEKPAIIRAVGANKVSAETPATQSTIKTAYAPPILKKQASASS